MNQSKISKYAGASILAAVLLSVCMLVQAAELRLAHSYPEGSLIDDWARNFSRCVMKTMDVPVRVIGDGRLGRPNDLGQAVVDGLIDLTLLPAADLATQWKEMAALAYPGLVYDPKDMMKLSGSKEFIRRLNEIGDGPGFELIALGWQYKVMVSDAKEWADLQGRKVSTADMATSNLVTSMGGRAINIPSLDIYPALHWGVIDGAIVDAEFVREFLPPGIGNSVYWSSDFAPFASPIVIVMNRWSAGALGGDIGRRLAADCGHDVTNEYNKKAVDLMAKLPRMDVRGISKEEKADWRKAHETIENKWLRGESGDLINARIRIVDAVDQAMKQ